MNEKYKKYLALIQKPKVLIIIGVSGILLIILSTVFNSGKKEPIYETENFSLDAYCSSLEENIKNIVKEISGDKKASVVITLEGSLEYSYADISEESISDEFDGDSSTEQSESKKEYIIIKNSDGSEKAVLLNTKMPEVRGVAIVCTGGDNEIINLKITNAVTAALNITSKRVYICGRKN